MYVLTILSANYARQAIMPDDAVPEWAVVVIVAATSAALFVVTTASYREIRWRRQRARR